MAEPRVLDRRTIEIAWAWHSWSPRWLPGRALSLLKRMALARLAEPGICTLDSGRKMLVTLDDAVQCTIAHAGEWEGLIYDAVADRVKPGDVVLDVGGHVGYSTLRFADWVGGGGRVFTFEPLEGNASRIEANLALNDLSDRVEIARTAVSDRAGEIEFESASPLNTGMGAIAPGKGSLRVPTIALDDWLASRSIERASLLKIDIEGAEALALAGLERTLADKRIAAILMEIHPVELPTFGSSVDQVLSRLKVAGYRLAFWDNVNRFAEGPMPADCGYLLAFA